MSDQTVQTPGDSAYLDCERALQALRDSDGGYRALVDASPTGLLVLQDGRWVYANPFVLALLRGRLEDLIGRPVLEFVHPSCHAWVIARLERLAAGLANEPGDIIAVRADGSMFTAEITSVPITLRGRPAVLVTTRDVSESRRLRHEREITLDLLRVLNAPGDEHELVRDVTRFLRESCPCDAVTFRWRDGRCLRHEKACSPEMAAGDETCGCIVDDEATLPRDGSGMPAPDCLCGLILRGEVDSYLPYLTPYGSYWTNDAAASLADVPDAVRRLLASYRCNALRFKSAALIPLRNGPDVIGVLQLDDRDTSRFSAEFVAFLENVAGQIAIALVQRQALAALSRSEQRLRRLTKAVDQAAEIVMVTATDGTIEYVNPAFERTTGYSREEALGAKPDIVRSWQHDDEFYESMWRTISGGEVWSGRIVNRRKDGGLYTEDMTIAPVKDDDGVIERFVAVKRDVSREIELEAQFRQVQRLESVGRLAAGVAHDLNNLLSPILGYSELLLSQGSADDSLRHPLTEIRHAAERSRDLVHQLLAFARKQVLQTHRLDVRDVVSGMRRLLRPTLRENIDLQFSLAAQPCGAMVDKGQIEQVLMNLVVNAQDAMPDGGRLVVHVDRVALDEEWCAGHTGATPGEFVRLRVTDSGHGMTPEVQAQVFEPFFTTKGVAGTGLGLSTVYGIVKQHGGSIFVESEVGRGTCVSVYLPAAEPPAAPEMRRALPGRPKGSEEVLVVEDNQQVRRLATLILQQHGYSVRTATSGAEAMELASAGARVDLLLTDVVMPDMNGKELYEKLLALRPGIRALFMSGYTPDVLGHQGVLDEGIFFLRKPFTVAELSTKVREALDQGA